MESIIDFLIQLKDFLNPKYLIDWLLGFLGVYVYFGLWFVIFAETGLAVGFFLPGDSLLVVSCWFAAAKKLNVLLVLIEFFLGSVM
ncbi:MAG: hypothetical protein ACRD6X_21905, partial [Pyrinomonadaceae bacterium]